MSTAPKLALRPAAPPPRDNPVPKSAAAGVALRAATAKKSRPMVFGRALNSKGLTIFTRQLATLVKAGMPILRSVEVLARQGLTPQITQQRRRGIEKAAEARPAPAHHAPDQAKQTQGEHGVAKAGVPDHIVCHPNTVS